MFLGEYHHSLDTKGRVALPSKFRARLARGCVLTKGQDYPCLAVFPLDEWDRFTAHLENLPQSSQQARNIARFLFSGASEHVPDGQGRVLIPGDLRHYAQLDRNVSIIGAGTRCEIWRQESWERLRGIVEREFSQVIEDNMDPLF